MNPVVRVIVESCKYLWALPNTLFGLAIGLLALATGGSVGRTGGVVEFHGGFANWLLRLLNVWGMTWGYVILGKDRPALDAVRAHELVHVEQYGKWGPFFIPAYALSSLIQLWKGKRMYRDNFLEVEAYAREPIVPPCDQTSATT